MEQNLISVATISGVQGLDGELKLFPLSDNPDRFTQMPGKRILWRRDGELRMVTVQALRKAGKHYLLTLHGVNTRSQAESFVGGDLAVPEAELLPLEEGSYYIYQLIGLTVYDETGRKLGQIKEVLQPGSNDVYVVDGLSGDILIPALKSVVKSVDLTLREMRVELPSGLLD